ncbi:MAG: UDP-N-acetylglucosamine 2-epimerase, partial [Bacteroidia bacterium]
MLKKILFITGTRADFGKLKSLIQITSEDSTFEVHIFATGMHLLEQYGYTVNEIEKSGFTNIHRFSNGNIGNGMDVALARTIEGLSAYVANNRPDLLVVHGDRGEALAGSIVGALNNILVAHIEGGEVSGTVDELIRHAVTKMSHLHFVSNEEARKRLIQLGEIPDNIHV